MPPVDDGPAHLLLAATIGKRKGLHELTTQLFLGEGRDLKLLGFGLAFAIFIDATIVRLVLVPALMELMGKWNWYLPSWLQWLPVLRVDAEQHPTSAGAGAAAGGGGK